MEILINNKIAQEIERIVSQTAQKQRRDCTFENRVLYIYTENSKMEPKECAERILSIWNHMETSGTVLGILKNCNLTPYEKRDRLFHRGYFIARDLAKMMTGEPVDNMLLQEIEGKLEASQEIKRIVLNHLYRLVPQLKQGKSFESMLKLNSIFAGECIDSIITFLKIEYGDIANAAEYEKEIFRLDSELKRKNSMLVTLQIEFDARIEENRKEECENLISQLNSAKYGYILDLLTSLQSGVRQLRHAGKQIPIEIGSLQSLVRQLLQFVEDCGITPIMGIGEELTVTADDIDNYQYQGTPFGENEKEKVVVVISTGWEIKDKELTLSRPTVQEKE